MQCQSCKLYPDCELEPPKDDKPCPYYDPKQKLNLTFTSDGMRMGG